MELKIKPSEKKTKKYDAIFTKDNNIKIVSFGAKNMSDYTIHKDKQRRTNYLARHKANENWNNPITAGSLSRFILWGPSTDLETNIKLFKKKFNLS
jgi:hypothetical protein